MMPSRGPADGHKIRGSCHACAVSKVRCTKEKPFCSRCRRRRTACEYLVTKRPGRKRQGTRSSGRPPGSTTDISLGLPDADLPTTFTLPEDPSLSVEDVFPGCSGVFSSPFDQAESSLSSSLTRCKTDFDDYLAALPLPEMANVGAGYPSQPDPSESQSDYRASGLQFRSSMATQAPPRDTIHVFGRPPSASRSPPSPGTLFASTAENLHQNPPSSHCHCLARALDLLKHLSATDLMPGATSDKQAVECFSLLPPSADSMILANQEAMDAINVMLQCRCSQDSYLLAILSLIMFKVLDRYTTAAEIGATPTDGDESLSRLPYPSPGSIRLSTSTDREDAGGESDHCMATSQRVLRELHRVQRAVNLLSPRLHACKTQHRPSTTPFSLLSGNISLAVSTTVIDQLEPELRKRLGALSLEIIHMLRSDE